MWDFSMSNILRIQNGNKFIETLQSVTEFEEFTTDIRYNENNECYQYASYIDLVELGQIKSRELECYYNLPSLGSGCGRATLSIGMGLCVKIALSYNGMLANRREISLQRYLKRECPELLPLFVPILGYSKNYIIQPMGITANVTDDYPRKYHIRQLLKVLKDKGLEIYDLENRPDNFILLDKQLKIADYSEWYTTSETLMRNYHYSQLTFHVEQLKSIKIA